MRRTAFAVMLLALAPQVAAATPCLTSGEFAAVARYATPAAIDGARERCATTLPAGAFLPTRGAALAARYSQGRQQAWPTAKAAFLKLSAADPKGGALIQSLPDQSLQQMLDAMFEGLVSSQLPLDQCGIVDRVIGLLAPLPPDNMAGMIALFAEMRGKHDGGKLGPLAICKAGA